MTQWEEREQTFVVSWCEIKHIPVFAIPNGGKRNPKEAAFMKAAGVKAGVPDLMMPIPSGKYHGLFIEMKYGKNKPTAEQLSWHALLRRNGYAVAVCYGGDAAVKTITDYLKGNDPNV